MHVHPHLCNICRMQFQDFSRNYEIFSRNYELIRRELNFKHDTYRLS